MTDEECIAWAEEEGVTLNACGKAKWFCEYAVRGVTYETEYVATPYDAIRAARKALESGK
jgi:hypothetical protein